MPRPCSLCHQPSSDGLASVYWAWYPGPNTRLAYRTKICPDCTTEHVVPIMAMSPLEREAAGDHHCAKCGILADEDEFFIYATVYLPGREPTEVEGLLCGACAAVATALLQTEGYRLPDRDPARTREKPLSPAWALMAG